MEIACENSSNFEYRLESLEILYYLQPGCWLELISALLGIFNNCILLILAYRLHWFFQPHYALIINQAFLDMLTALVIIIESSYTLIHYHSNTPSITSQWTCLAMTIPIQIIETCNQRSALIVAIDRLINVISPYRWATLGLTYRLIMIAIAVFWSMIQEIGWLAFLDPGTCVTICYSYFSYPNTWWVWVVTVSDTLTSGFIISAYVVLPTLTSDIFRRLSCKNFVVALDELEKRQSEMVKRVRRLSMLTITSYLCTTFIAFTFSDMTPAFASKVSLSQMAFIQPFSGVLVTMNTILPLYLFAWKEESFRKQLRSMFSLMYPTVTYYVSDPKKVPKF